MMINKDLFTVQSFPWCQISPTGQTSITKVEKLLKMKIRMPRIFVLTCKWYALYSLSHEEIRTGYHKTHIWWASSIIEDKLRSLHNLLKFCCPPRRIEIKRYLHEGTIEPFFPVMILVHCMNYSKATANGRGDHAAHTNVLTIFFTWMKMLS